MNQLTIKQFAKGTEIITIKSGSEVMTKQGLPNFIGISANNAGAKGIAMNIVIIPPGAKAEPHYHDGYETAIYLLKGKVETKYGKGLEQSVINESGDFIFIPASLPHQPVNLSDTEPAVAIIARNDPNEQESVVLYDAAKENKVIHI
jgi:uncharacterized RmlC-like cupin family protein